jgi:hypothetical protein
VRLSLAFNDGFQVPRLYLQQDAQRRVVDSFKLRLQPACAAPRPIIFVQVDSVFELDPDGVQFCSLVVHGQSFMWAALPPAACTRRI